MMSHEFSDQLNPRQHKTVDVPGFFRITLDVAPVFDGLIAAGGELYMATVDGKVACLAAPRR